jgi:hypothetical protein
LIRFASAAAGSLRRDEVELMAMVLLGMNVHGSSRSRGGTESPPIDILSAGG